MAEGSTEAKEELTNKQTTTDKKPDVSFTRLIHRFFRRIYKIVSSTLGLVVALLIYSFAGAAIFHAIEGIHEYSEKSDIIEVRDEVVQSAWNFSRNFSSSQESEFTEAMQLELKKYEDKLHEAFLHGINSDTDVQVWDFWGAFLFCATVYTTIGYGHIAPATDVGKVATMIYALFGIPLCLVVLAELGKKLTLFLKFLWSFVRRFYKTGTCKKVIQSKPIQAIDKSLKKIDKSEAANRASEAQDETETVPYAVDDDFNLPPVIAVGITVAYICAGASMYLEWEDNWGYLDAFYFIFISISTVGFGDVLPEHPRYFLASSIYILIGLSLVAMVINVIMEVVNDTLDKAKVKVISAGHKFGIDLSAEELDKAVAVEKKTNGD